MASERRLVFGEAAELYDRSRPSYPSVLIDDLVALAGLDGGRTVLEVGAGTGKATAMLAARGIPVLAIEPSAKMAAVARRNCAAYPGVEIELRDFERWLPGGREFPLICAAQSWHWIEPELRYARARAAACRGGLLAAFWNRPRWDRSQLRAELAAVYRKHAPELDRELPMHPANELVLDGDGDWLVEVEAATGWQRGEVRSYDWTQTYSPAQYAELIGSLSETLLMDSDRRRELLAAIRAAIEAGGGSIRMSYATRLCLARAA